MANPNMPQGYVPGAHTAANAQQYNPHGSMAPPHLAQSGGPGLFQYGQSFGAQSQQYQNLSGMYAASAVATSMQYAGGAFFMGMPMAHPVLKGMGYTRTAGIMRGLDPFRQSMRLPGAVTSFGQGLAKRGGSRLAVGLGRSIAIGGGVMSGGALIAGMAAMEMVGSAASNIYLGAKQNTFGASFLNMAAPSGVTYSSQEAQTFGKGSLQLMQSQFGMDSSTLAGVSQQLSAQGEFEGVRGLSEFKRKLSKSLANLKELAEVTNTTMGEANQLVEQLKGVGFKDTASSTAAVKNLMLSSQVTGMDAGRIARVGGMASQQGFQLGLDRTKSFEFGATNVASLQHLYNRGEVDRSLIQGLGGVDAVAASVTQKTQDATSMLGLMLIDLKKDASGEYVGEVNKERMAKLMSGELDIQKEMEKIRSPKNRRERIRQQNVLMEMVEDHSLRKELMGSMSGLVQNLSYQDPGQLQDFLGMHKNQVEIFTKMQAAKVGMKDQQDELVAQRRLANARARSEGTIGTASMLGEYGNIGERTGFNKYFQNMGSDISNFFSDVGGYFQDTKRARRSVTQDDYAHYAEMKRTGAMEGLDMAKYDKIFERFRGSDEAYGLGGMFKGGSEMDLRRRLYSDPTLRRFVKSADEQFFGDMEGRDGQREFRDYVYVDAPGSNLFVFEEDELVFDMQQARKAFRGFERGATEGRRRGRRGSDTELSAARAVAQRVRATGSADFAEYIQSGRGVGGMFDASQKRVLYDTMRNKGVDFTIAMNGREKRNALRNQWKMNKRSEIKAKATVSMKGASDAEINRFVDKELNRITRSEEGQQEINKHIKSGEKSEMRREMRIHEKEAFTAQLLTEDNPEARDAIARAMGVAPDTITQDIRDMDAASMEANMLQAMQGIVTTAGSYDVVQYNENELYEIRFETDMDFNTEFGGKGVKTAAVGIEGYMVGHQTKQTYGKDYADHEDAAPVVRGTGYRGHLYEYDAAQRIAADIRNEDAGGAFGLDTQLVSYAAGSKVTFRGKKTLAITGLGDDKDRFDTIKGSQMTQVGEFYQGLSTSISKGEFSANKALATLRKMDVPKQVRDQLTKQIEDFGDAEDKKQLSQLLDKVGKEYINMGAYATGQLVTEKLTDSINKQFSLEGNAEMLRSIGPAGSELVSYMQGLSPEDLRDVGGKYDAGKIIDKGGAFVIGGFKSYKGEDGQTRYSYDTEYFQKATAAGAGHYVRAANMTAAIMTGDIDQRRDALNRLNIRTDSKEARALLKKEVVTPTEAVEFLKNSNQAHNFDLTYLKAANIGTAKVQGGSKPQDKFDQAVNKFTAAVGNFKTKTDSGDKG